MISSKQTGLVSLTVRQLFSSCYFMRPAGWLGEPVTSQTGKHKFGRMLDVHQVAGRKYNNRLVLSLARRTVPMTFPFLSIRSA